jgi:hypothetical protein
MEKAYVKQNDIDEPEEIEDFYEDLTTDKNLEKKLAPV